jgi:hypothetical protein
MSHDYADEFDVDCCFVADKREFNKNMSIVQLAFDANVLTEDDEYYFGTNEFLQFYSFDDFEMGVSDQPCSEEFYHEFINMCGGQVGYNVLESMVEKATARAAKLDQEEDEE